MDLSTRQGRREQGQRIQRAVERAGLSIEELAGRIGCSRALIYQYVSGTTLAQPDRLQQIGRECGVPLAYFYADTSEASDATLQAPASRTAETASPSSLSSSEAAPPPREVTARLRDSLRSLQELAEAQEMPPDYRALASTSERILSLASQLGDRNAQSRAQKQLGTARLRIADYPRAAEALSRAVAFAIEAGDVESETGARQSLGTSLVSMGRIQEAREQFQRIASGSVFRGRWQGTLSLGGIHTLHGEYDRAMQRFDEAAAILEDGEAQGLASASEIAVGALYVNTNRRSVYMNGGDFQGARPLAEKGVADAEALGNADQHLEARFDLAWCDFGIGRWAQAHHGFATQLQLARFVGDQGRETMGRAWMGIFLAAAGDFDSAIAYGKDALAMALSRGDRRGELYSQLALADAYTGATGRESEARYHIGQALAVATALHLDRAEIECRIRWARLYVQTADSAGALETLPRALNLAGKLGARHLESLCLCWQAEAGLLDRREAPPTSNPVEGGETSAVNPTAPVLETVTAQARRALALADEIGFVEGQWRSHRLLARLEQNAPNPNGTAADEHLRAAITLLESLRAGLQEAGISDTLLENEDCLTVYADLIRLLRADGRRDEADALLEQTGWPPLSARVGIDSATDADSK